MLQASRVVQWPTSEPAEPWRYTMRPAWSSRVESAWMRVSKFSLYNRLTQSELTALLISNRTTRVSIQPTPARIDLRHAAAVDATAYKTHLGMAAGVD